MKTALKAFAWITGVVLALIVIAVLALTLLFDPNAHKDTLIKTFHEHTGRELIIPGKISLTFFPWLGVELGQLKVGQAADFATSTKKPFAEIKHAAVRVKLLPLFKKQLEVDTVVLEGLQLELIKNKAGQGNWLFAPVRVTTATKTEEPTETSASLALAAFAIGGVELNNAAITWQDYASGQHVEITRLNLNTGKLISDAWIAVNTQFAVREHSSKLNGNVAFATQLRASRNLQQIAFKDLSLQPTLTLAALKQPLTPILTSHRIDIDLQQQTLSSKKIDLGLYNLQLSSQILVKQLLSQPDLQAQLTINNFRPKELAAQLGIALPSLANPKALTNLSLQARLHGNLSQVNVDELSLKLDQSQLVGKLRYLLSPKQSMHYTLKLDQINLDDYLPADDKQATTKPTQASQAQQAAALPFVLLHQLQMNGDLNVSQLQLMKTHWKNLQLTTQTTANRIILKPIRIEGYGTALNADTQITLLKNSAQLQANLAMQNLKAGDLLKDFADIDKLQGNATLTANLNSQGMSMDALISQLNGKAQFRFSDGVIKGIDLQHYAEVIKAKLKQQAEPPAPSPMQTPFAEISGSLSINKGIANNRDLSAATLFARAQGQGQIDLVKQQLDYLLSLKFTSSTEVTDGRSYAELARVPLDIHIHGPFSQLKIEPDYSKALKGLAKQELEKQKQQLKEKANDKLKEKLEKKAGDALKKLLRF